MSVELKWDGILLHGGKEFHHFLHDLFHFISLHVFTVHFKERNHYLTINLFK